LTFGEPDTATFRLFDLVNLNLQSYSEVRNINQSVLGKKHGAEFALLKCSSRNQAVRWELTVPSGRLNDYGQSIFGKLRKQLKRRFGGNFETKRKIHYVAPVPDSGQWSKNKRQKVFRLEYLSQVTR
jgi:hypothetical protein